MKSDGATIMQTAIGMPINESSANKERDGIAIVNAETIASTMSVLIYLRFN